MKIKASTSTVFSSITILIIVSTILLIRLSHPPKNNLKYDVFGYYLYLPALFIYSDLGLKDKETFDKLVEKYRPSPTFYQINRGPEDYWMMKYSMGMAVLYSPAFFTGHLVALNSGYPADGFSKPYQRSLMFYNFFITLMGLLVLRKVLLKFFPDAVSATVLLLIYFGTNYFSYSTLNAEMPHNYLFTLYAFILWFTIKWHEKFRVKYLRWLALFIGLAALARPSELIVLIIPLFWNVEGYRSLIKKIQNIWANYKPQLLQFLLILIFIGSLQLIYWLNYSGSLIYFSYRNPGEGFDFLWPYTLKFLFSFRKGWLIYTPLMLFALWGLYLLGKRNRQIFYSVFIFFIFNLYVVSSWSNWWYAQSMGQRAMVQSYAVMAIPLGYAVLEIMRFSLPKRILISLPILFFVVLNLFQTWQMRFEIISRDRMTMAYYLKSFGNLEKDQDLERFLLIDRTGGGSKKIPDNRNYQQIVLSNSDFEFTVEKQKNKLTDSISHSGQYSLKMDDKLEYAASFTIPYKEITNKYYAWIRTSFWVYPVTDPEESKLMLVVSFQHKGKGYKYRRYPIQSSIDGEKLLPHQWNKVTFDYLTPEVRSKDDNLAVYLWNRGKEEIFIDDMVIQAFEEE